MISISWLNKKCISVTVGEITCFFQGTLLLAFKHSSGTCFKTENLWGEEAEYNLFLIDPFKTMEELRVEEFVRMHRQYFLKSVITLAAKAVKSLMRGETQDEFISISSKSDVS